MAKFKLNNMVEAAAGKVGKMNFRTVGNTIQFNSNPVRKKEKSPKQMQQTERFKRAAAYAKVALQDPAVKQEYKEKALSLQKDFVNAFSIAVQDYLKSPVVDAIHHEAYSGAVGDEIRITVFDELKVQEVHVSILRSSGQPLESGVASPMAGNTAWKYHATQQNNPVTGSKIIVTVVDKPGNTTVKEVTL